MILSNAIIEDLKRKSGLLFDKVSTPKALAFLQVLLNLAEWH